jgi:hypothetical protein
MTDIGDNAAFLITLFLSQIMSPNRALEHESCPKKAKGKITYPLLLELLLSRPRPQIVSMTLAIGEDTYFQYFL